MFLFLPPPFVFTLSLAAFLVFFFLAPNSKGYLRAGLFSSASLCCVYQLPLEREGVNTLDGWKFHMAQLDTLRLLVNLRTVASETVVGCPRLT